MSFNVRFLFFKNYISLSGQPGMKYIPVIVIGN
jgi:hypothetical protein